jgi:hypothetical protein
MEIVEELAFEKGHNQNSHQATLRMVGLNVWLCCLFIDGGKTLQRVSQLFT